MRSRTQIAALAVVMIIAIGTTVMPAMAATTGDSSTGSFNLGNAAPSVTAISLHAADHSDTTISAMDPQTEYAVKIDISDANTLNDVNEIIVIIKTNNTGTGDSDSVTDKATFRWTTTGGGTWGPLESTWTIIHSNSSKPDNFGATAGTWWLNFVPGKVAKESNAWDIYVNVTDKGSLTGDKIVWGYTMNWYGEISAIDTSYTFGNVNLGTTENNITDPNDGNIGVTAIANGAYKLESKTSTTWTGQNTSDVATVDPGTGTLDAGEIRLIDNAANSYSGGSKVQTDEYEPIAGYSTLSGPTDENGASHDIYQWLDVASEGLLPDTYQGTYYVQIADAA